MYLTNSGALGRGPTASVKVIDRPPLPPPIPLHPATMTAPKQLTIPGLDHSLYKREDGLFVWLQTPSVNLPPVTKHAKRRKTKTASRRHPGPHPGQKTLWQDMA